MSSQYTTCVSHGDYLYGVHGREDFGNGELRCIEIRSGKVMWSATGFGIGHPILVGDQLLILTSNGELVLVAAQPDKFRELARATVAAGVTRSLPALSNGQFYFRDNNGDEGKLTCLGLEN